MFLSAVLFVAFLAGCWLAFVWFIARESRRIRYRSLMSADHPAITGYDALNVSWYPHEPTTAAETFPAAEALARHPANRSRNAPGRPVPIGPDDDPEFLRQLAERIRGEQ
jgi:hypothetical protein